MPLHWYIKRTMFTGMKIRVRYGVQCAEAMEKDFNSIKGYVDGPYCEMCCYGVRLAARAKEILKVLSSEDDWGKVYSVDASDLTCSVLKAAVGMVRLADDLLGFLVKAVKKSGVAEYSATKEEVSEILRCCSESRSNALSFLNTILINLREMDFDYPEKSRYNPWASEAEPQEPLKADDKEVVLLAENEYPGIAEACMQFLDDGNRYTAESAATLTATMGYLDLINRVYGYVEFPRTDKANKLYEGINTVVNLFRNKGWDWRVVGHFVLFYKSKNTRVRVIAFPSWEDAVNRVLCTGKNISE